MSDRKRNAERQREFKRRMRERGFRQKTIWIREADYQSGYEAAQIGAASMGDPPPPGVHRLSWVLGWLEWAEKRDRAMRRYEAKRERD